MTNETRNRIHAYKEALPQMKERVVAALLMLVIAAGVVASSTYAWVTLSRSPEVGKTTTTLAANGVLEIALSKPDGSQPDEFDIDESILNNDSDNVTVSNLQWGNLVNLSDEAYGIDNLALRPAQLNDSDLLNNPLWGATYGEDGRITELNYYYTYTKYNGSQFLASKEYGVRAISSYTVATSDATTQMRTAKITAVGTAQGKVNTAYETDVGEAFSALGDLISRVAQDRVNKTSFAVDSTATDSVLNEFLPDLYDFYKALKNAMDLQKDAYTALANLQLYQYIVGGEDRGEFAETNWATIEADYGAYNVDPDNPDAGSENGIIALTGLSDFIEDYTLLCSDMAWFEAYIKDYEANGTKYYWSHNDGGLGGPQISTMIEELIAYGDLYLIINGEEVTIGEITDYAMDLYGAQGPDNPYPVYVTGGILQRFEQSVLDTGRLDGATCNITIEAKVAFVTDSVEIYGKAYTTATGSSYFTQNFTATRNQVVDSSEKIAEDTYGLVVDLWVRTNAETTCLTLEGAITTDEQGTYSYDGVNRVWGYTDGDVLTTDSTTQGGGSCYIYYADTPEDAARSLELLNAMKVAFVSESGKLLATAEMDTANALEINGRITVPLVLEERLDTLTYTYIDSSNIERIGHAITTLYTDVPVRVTAIVYLDGEDLTNDDVLAAAEIEGSLNIQFGSSVELSTLGSNELIDDVRYVTATASKYDLNFDDKVSDEDMETLVTLNVEGTKPDSITAFFVRAINSTQGTREEEMEFQQQDDGTWTHTYQFKAPGTYYLRHVRLDGVDYALSEPLEITVSGFELASATWDQAGAEVTVRTSASTYPVKVAATFASDDVNKMPASVQMRFVNEKGYVVSVPLTYKGSGRWEGETSFSMSGVYTMGYIVYTLDGEATGRFKDLGSFKKTLDLSLGMSVSVDNLNNTLWDNYEEGVSYPKSVGVHIYNNSGNELTELENLVLYYCNAGDLTNTRSANLTWDALKGYYSGTLLFDKPGNWQFAYVKMADGNMLKKCTDSKVYTIISPDPPIYDTTSNMVNDCGEYQLVPLANDARISGLTIYNSSAADVSVVVYSEAAKQYYVISNTADDKTIVTISGNTWTVKLPTYTLDLDENGNPVEGANYQQEGKWSVAAVILSNCYDENKQFRSSATTDGNGDSREPNPIVWVGDDAVSQAWLADSGLTADDSYDFSALATNVSQSVMVTMIPGETDLGGADYEFMHTFYVGGGENVSDVTSYVLVTDKYKNPIPRSKVGNVTLALKYTGNTNTDYGYKVTTAENNGANYAYTLDLKWPENEENGHYTISNQVTWQYVGEYKVTGLTVQIGNETLTYSPGNADVPTMYTVTTSGPDADDITMTVEEKLTLPLGKTGSNVTGTFLQSYNLGGIRAVFQFASESGANAAYVDLTDFVSDVKLALSHQGGNEENGGYTWSGTSDYENITLSMTSSGSTYTAGSSTPLLAGTYTGYITAKIGDETVTKDLKNQIDVFSMLPDVKITEVKYIEEVEVTVDNETQIQFQEVEIDEIYINENTSDTTHNHLVEYVKRLGPVYNQFGSYYAVVYMAYAEGAADKSHQEECDLSGTDAVGASYYTYVNYTQPGIKFKLSNGGTGTANIQVGMVTAELTNDKESGLVPIGSIVSEKTKEIDKHKNGITNCYYIYTYDKATLLDGNPDTPDPDPVVIDEITSKVGNTTYTRTLQNSLTISQPNKQNPTLTWNAGEGVSIEVTCNGTAYDDTTTAIPLAAELIVTVTAEYGYHDPILKKPEGVSNWDVVSEDVNQSVYKFRIMGDAELIASAEKYPEIVFNKEVDNTSNSVADTKITVNVTVNGVTKEDIDPNTGVEPGAEVEVTVTAVREDGYCKPIISTAPDNAIDWSETKVNDFTTVYTFVMPDMKVTLDAEGMAMQKLTWEEHAAITFYVQDKNGSYASGAFIVPGNTLTITLDCTEKQAGMNPYLKEPTNLEPVSSSLYVAKYSYTMPESPLNLIADADSYPGVDLTNAYANYTVYRDYAPDKPITNEIIGVKPGSTVTVVLTPKSGYYAPKMDELPADWTMVEETITSVTYTFTMPETAVNAGGRISATACVVTYEANGGSSTASQTYAGTELVLPTTTRVGYRFDGWYTAAIAGDRVGGAGDKYTPTANITLYAQWTAYTVTYDYATNGGSGSPASAVYSNGLILPTPDARTGYTFNGWYTAATGGDRVGGAGDNYAPTTNIKLYAQWSINSYTITVKATNATVTVNGATVSNNGTKTIQYGATVTVNVTYSKDSDQSTTIKGTDGTTYTSPFTMPAQDVTITASSSCVTPDTLITLEDGTQVRVDSLSGDELLLVWNLETGTLDSAPILFVDSDPNSEYEIIYLHFSDGTEVKVISEHGFWDYDLNRYVYLDNEAAQYIGHSFAKETNGKLERVTLVDVNIRKELTSAWSPVTAEHLCYFVNGMLSMPGGIDGLFNIFEVNPETMSYDLATLAEDIKTYGLFTYEELNAIAPLTRDMFESAGGAYLKVSIGKGNLTLDELIAMINRYSKFFD